MMEEGDSEPVGTKGQCPCDDPSSSFQLYSDGHGFCFAGGCPHPRWSPKQLADAGLEVDPDLIAADVTHSRSRPRMDEDLKDLLDSSEVRALTKRKITQATCEHWDYRTRIGKDGRGEHVAVFRNRDNQITGAKVRTEDKEFFVVGDIGHFYGEHLLKKGGKKLIIVGGEIDTLTVSQLWGNKFPVVSPAKGEKHLAKAVAACLEDINRFDEVVFGLDMDEVGRHANIEAAKLLPPGKAKIADYTRKDPNEMLMSGESEKLTAALTYGTSEYRPDGIVSAKDLVQRAKEKPTWGLRFGLKFLDDLQWGWRDEEIVVLGAGIGMGKSDLMYQVAADLLDQGVPVAVFNYEASSEESFSAIAGKRAKRRFDVPDPEDGSPNLFYTEQERDRAFDELGGMPLYVNDDNGAVSWEAVKERLRFLVHAHGVRRAFVDPMAALAASLASDERTGLDKLMAEAKALCKELKIGLWFNSHLARPSEGKSHEEGGRVTQRNFRGSGGITLWASLVIGMERNQQAEDEVEASTTLLRSLKVRKNGKAVGRIQGYIWDEMTGFLEPKSYPLAGDGEPEQTVADLTEYTQ